MAVTSVDTLSLSKRLQRAGLDKKVAEELTEIIKETHSDSIASLATKQDLEMVRRDLEMAKKILSLS